MSQKIELPALPWGYDELEPHISREINELHHKKHHQTYVNGFNTSIVELLAAEKNSEVTKIIEIQRNINFFAGGHVNHSLFWKNLSPSDKKGGKFPKEDSAFAKQVVAQYGSFDKLIELTNKKLAGIQGSGWAFIVKNTATGNTVDVVTTYNQDTVTAPFVPLVAIDAWEHAYYLQYQNVKLDYFKAIWNVINWDEAEQRYAKL